MDDEEAGRQGGAHAASDDGAPSAATKPLSAKKLAKLKEKSDRRGVVYMARVPPHLKPLRLRQMLEGHAKLGRIYMAPKDSGPKGGSGSGAGKTKKQRKEFSEAWIEFQDKRQARAVAELLNGNPMGGKNRSKYHDDLWTLKYLSKFKWDHLTEEVAYQKAVREKRTVVEVAAAKRDRDFFLGKVAQARKSEAIVARKRKRGEQIEAGDQVKPRTFLQRDVQDDAQADVDGRADVLSLFASRG